MSLTHAYRHGLVLGKFMPAHRGHAHLVRFACGLCEHVTVVVDRLAAEWPHAAQRAAALRADLAGLPVRVVSLTDDMPQEPHEHPAFWELWRDTLLLACGELPDALVASMDYGLPLSRELGCRFIPLDTGREALPFTATAIRSDPWLHWDEMLPHSRLPYLSRVSLEGPESTGKSTISRLVADTLGFGHAPEWARGYIAQDVRAGKAFQEGDLLAIARGQLASERSLELQARFTLVCDTSLLTTIAWSQFLYGRTDPRIEVLFEQEEARAPRMRWFLTPEVPWQDDVHRRVASDTGAQDSRQRFWDVLTTQAARRGLQWTEIGGGFAARRAQCLEMAGSLKCTGGPEHQAPADLQPGGTRPKSR
jgi:HTH-type transcriptional repressor of NAD biosynthesis genes